MKRLAALILTVILVPALCVMANDKNDYKNNSSSKSSSSGKTYSQRSSQKSGSTRQSVVINMNRGSSGGHNRNYPSQQKQQPAQKQVNNAPSYGKLQWTSNNQSRKQVPNQAKNYNKTSVNSGVNATSVVHHHPYQVNYVRKKLQKLGVKTEPGYITNREEVIHTDRAHSVIAYPKTGFNNRPLNAAMVSSRHFNDSVVRTHMSLVAGVSWQAKIRGFNLSETSYNHYYWHNNGNFSYCHYIDNSGYHWYGWYVGNKYFWTRNFNNRWWWYDTGYDRWCFWNDGFWWWQDPYHMGDLYCYNDTGYVPVNSAEDNVAVTVPEGGNAQNFTSPDNTRVVKVVADTEDAYLYDTANPPTFNPIYLASGVKDVMYSDPSNGRPLEIILKLNDNSFDMFDASGNPYNPGTAEGNEQSPQSDQGAPVQ